MKTDALVANLRLQAAWMEDWDYSEAQLLRAAAKKLEKQRAKIKKLKGQISGRPAEEKFYEED